MILSREIYLLFQVMMEQISFLTSAVYQTSPDNRQVSTEPVSGCPRDYQAYTQTQVIFHKEEGNVHLSKGIMFGKVKSESGFM